MKVWLNLQKSMIFGVLGKSHASIPVAFRTLGYPPMGFCLNLTCSVCGEALLSSLKPLC